MASTTSKTILINGDPQAENRQFEDLQITASAVTPGMLVEINPTSEKMRKHATAGGNHSGMVVLENPFADTTGQAIAFDWPTNSFPKYIVARPGDKLYMLFTSSTTIDKGDLVESAGDGTLQEHTADTVSGTASLTVYSNQIVGVAWDDLSSTTGSQQRITVLVI